MMDTRGYTFTEGGYRYRVIRALDLLVDDHYDYEGQCYLVTHVQRIGDLVYARCTDGQMYVFEADDEVCLVA